MKKEAEANGEDAEAIAILEDAIQQNIKLEEKEQAKLKDDVDAASTAVTDAAAAADRAKKEADDALAAAGKAKKEADDANEAAAAATAAAAADAEKAAADAEAEAEKAAADAEKAAADAEAEADKKEAEKEAAAANKLLAAYKRKREQLKRKRFFDEVRYLVELRRGYEDEHVKAVLNSGITKITQADEDDMFKNHYSEIVAGSSINTNWDDLDDYQKQVFFDVIYEARLAFVQQVTNLFMQPGNNPVVKAFLRTGVTTKKEADNSDLNHFNA